MPTPSRNRDTCYRCLRPAEHCLCAFVSTVDNQTPVLVVQHPRERKHAFNTVRFLELCLRRVDVVVDHVGTLRRTPEALPLLPGAGLLYPGRDARDVTTLSRSERPSQLVVIDGTWHQARTLYRDIGVLQRLPHLTLPDGCESEFAIRRQPARYCLSSVEAIAMALGAIEPETRDVGKLLDGFRAMIARQRTLPLERRRHRSSGRTRARGLPVALVEDFRHLVVAYGESVPSSTGRQLVVWAARRLATGEEFLAALDVADARESHLAHMRLNSVVLGGRSVEEFRSGWLDFFREQDVLGVWNAGALGLLDAHGLRPRRSVVLKAAYNSLGRHQGSLDQVLRCEESGGEEAVASKPRFRERLDNAARAAALMHRIAAR